MQPSGRKIKIGLYALLVLLPVVVLLLLAQPGPSRLEQVQKRGTLVMLTRNGASSYFLGSDGPMGPEYERVKLFADFLGVKLKVRVAPAFHQLKGLLNDEDGDLIAANLTRTAKRELQFRFGPDYDKTQIEVVYRRGMPRPHDLSDLVGKHVAVIAGTSYEEQLEAAQSDYPDLQWDALSDAGIEDVLQSIDNGEIDITLVDANIFAINRNYYPGVAAGFTLDDSQPEAWAFKLDDDDSLAQAADVFMKQAANQGELAEIDERYSSEQQELDQVGMFQFLKQVRERLPGYLPIFQSVASAHDLDWRLLAAMGYQESHWDAQAASPTGVRGLMMLTRRTAVQLGLKDRTDPNQSIEGGARYLVRMWRKIPDRIPEPDRTWMALAAYNMGWSHLEDARVLTERQGGDPDQWSDIATRLPLLTQEKTYLTLRNGYAPGRQAQRYVRNIRKYFDILVWMDTREHPLLVADSGYAP